MRCARLIGTCRLREGPPLQPDERCWICEPLDADLLPTGRVVVALGTGTLDPGSLVRLGPPREDGRPFDLRIEARVEDVGVSGSGGSDEGRRVWLAEGRRRPRDGQPQNRH